MDIIVMVLVIGAISFVAYLGTRRVLAEDSSQSKGRSSRKRRR